MVELKELAVPCPFMVFKADGYHECSILREQGNSRTGSLCAWFYDCFRGTDDFVELMYEVKDGKPINPILIHESTHLPDVHRQRMKDFLIESDVPKICPKGYTFKQISAKIQPLMDKVDWEKVRNGQVE